MQYSAASFVETMNSGSLSIEPDEFLARMVEAGVAHLPSSPPDGPITPRSTQLSPATMPSSPLDRTTGAHPRIACKPCLPQGTVSRA